MHTNSRIVLASLVGVGVVMIFLLGFHVGGTLLLTVGNFCPLVGALIGGTLVLVCVNRVRRQDEDGEPWLRNEQLAWTLIGCGCIAWAIGEFCWRYYRGLGQNPFPSLADFGYASFPPLIFIGLILLPVANKSEQRRALVLLDSLIATGVLLSIAWFLLLGSLAQTPTETGLGKVLAIYYPTVDTLLVSCTVFLLLRGAGASSQAQARRISLLVAGAGVCVFASSDFIFNVQRSLGTGMEGSWVALGWPLGIMAIGAAAYLRSFLPVSSRASSEQELKQLTRQLQFGATQTLPYLLLVVLLCVLVFNVLSPDSVQQSIRVVLVGATMLVVGLVIARQVLTLIDNEQLMLKQTATLQELAKVHQSIVDRNGQLEEGITHLKDIQTRLANGDVRARAHILNGDLWPLATGLNLMADRMMHSERNQNNAQKVAKAIEDFSQTMERTRSGLPLVIPVSCLHVPEMHRLFQVLGIKLPPDSPPTAPRPTSTPARNTPITPQPDATSSIPTRPAASRQWKEARK